MARMWRHWFLAALASSGLAGAAKAGPHVDWLDDGTVVLKLGPAYDNTAIRSTARSSAACSGPISSRSQAPPSTS